MYFPGDPIKVVGHIDIDVVDHIFSQVSKNFQDKWVQRTFKLMDTTFCIKAITPSQFDKVDAITETKFKNLLLPYVESLVGKDETLIYLDMSSVPPGAKLLPHIDYARFHQLSRRLIIPVVTNPKAVFALKTVNGIFNYNLKVGKIYEVNNQVLHTSINMGDTDRWHIIIDIIDNTAYEYLKKTDINAWGVDPSINFSFDQKIVNQLTDALKTPPINI